MSTTPSPRRAWFSGSLRASVFGWGATVLGSLPLFPTIERKGFLAIGVFGAALVTLTGIGLRALRANPAIVVLAQAVVFAEWIVVVFAGHQAGWGLLVNGRVLHHLRDLLHSGDVTAQTYTAPAPDDPGLRLMLVIAIGLLAIMVDVIVAALRRVPWAGVPLLAMYAVPVATVDRGIAWPYFVISAIGYTTLLMADERERVSFWGRVIPRSPHTPLAESTIDTSALTWLGRRISVVALGLAVVVPWLVPDVSGAFFGSGNGTGPGTGTVGGGLTFQDPMVGLAQNLHRNTRQTLLTVTTKDKIEPSYVRLAVVDQPSPDGWFPTDPKSVLTFGTIGRFTPPPGLGADIKQTAFTETFSVNPALGTSWLPVPYNIKTLSVENSLWRYDPERQTVQSFASVGSIAPYDVHAATVEPTATQLRAAPPPPQTIQGKFGTVPANLPTMVTDLSHTITQGDTNDYDKAIAIQRYLRDPAQFRYDENVPGGNGYQALVNFLRQGRGYCQQYAAAMAYLARAAGIPSRVAIGFLSPYSHHGDSYTFTSWEMHSWPELYFEGAGWVLFEPTPFIAQPPKYAGGRDPSTTPSSNTPTVTGRGSLSTNSLPTDGSPGGTGGGPGGSAPSGWWLLALGAVAVTFTPALLRLGLRRTRLARAAGEPGEAESAWAELRDQVRDLRLPWPGSLTPRARRRQVAPMLKGDPDGTAALDRLAISVERSRYARTPLPGAAPVEDVRVVTTALVHAQERSQRLLAYLVPRSLFDKIWPPRLWPRTRGWTGGDAERAEG